MNTTALFIVHQTKPGKRQDVQDIWAKHMAPAVQANPGHLAYVYSFDKNNPDGICAFQLYASEAEAKAFLNHPSYLAYLKEVEPLLVGAPGIRTLLPQWVKAA